MGGEARTKGAEQQLRHGSTGTVRGGREGEEVHLSGGAPPENLGGREMRPFVGMGTARVTCRSGVTSAVMLPSFRFIAVGPWPK
jgi:hypothetical protein